MPDPTPETETATERFNRLWEEIGAKRITIGGEDSGVEIRVDADLSPFAILDKLKAAAESGHAKGQISDDEEKLVKRTLDDTLRTLSGDIHDKLRDQFAKLTGKT